MPISHLSRDSSQRSANQLDTPCFGRQGSSEARNPIDWNTNVVNFISSCGHPGLVRRTSFGTAHASQDSTVQRKTRHRRNHSAITTLGFHRHPETTQTLSRLPPHAPTFHPQFNNYNSVRRPTMVPFPYYGHTRNISDPTSCWEHYHVDNRRMALPLYFEPTVYPVLSLSRQLSATTPEELSASDELKNHAFPPYFGPDLKEYPDWEEVDEREKAELPTKPPTTTEYRVITRESRCLFPCCQPCATPVSVLFGLSFIIFVQTMVSSGLLSSMLTTLEQRFDFTSRQMGYMISCLEGSGVLTTVAVSFINGRKQNRLRIVGLFTLLVSCGFALFTLPHFLVGPYEQDIQVNKRTAAKNFSNSEPGDRKAYSSNTNWSLELLIFYISMVLAGVGGSPINVLAPTYLWDNLSAKQYPIYSALFYSASGLGPACGFLAGAGFLSVFIDYPFRAAPEGFTRVNPLWLGNWWLGILICAAVLFIAAWPVIAFPKRLGTQDSVQLQSAIAAKTSMGDFQNRSTPSVPHLSSTASKVSNSLQRLYDSCLHRVHSTRDTKSKHRAISESALPKEDHQKEGKFHFHDLRRAASVGCCPRKSASLEQCPVALKTLPHKAQERVKSYLLVLRRVLTNPIWFGVTFTSMVEHSVVSAFLTYVSKYIQGLFHVPAYLASIHTGAVVVPSSLLGVLSGAMFMRHYRPRIHRTLIAITTIIGTTVVTTIALMLIGCSSNRFAGLTATYDGRPWPWAYGPVRLAPPNLTAPCNAERGKMSHTRAGSCSTVDFNPVCWERTDATGAKEHMTFFNPCFAGCPALQTSDSSSQFYHNCTCVTAESLNPLGSHLLAHDPYVVAGRVRAGRCSVQCPQYTVFLGILFLHILLTGMLQNPSNVITLSCVAAEDSSVALGLQVFLMRTLAYIPAPIYFGQLFDFVCQFRLAPKAAVAAAAASPYIDVNASFSTTHRAMDSPQSNGACLQYNLEGLPLVWLGLILALKLVSLLGAITTWHVARHHVIKSQTRTTQSNRHGAATASPTKNLPKPVLPTGVQSVASV